jgi:hypothetical protein
MHCEKDHKYKGDEPGYAIFFATQVPAIQAAFQKTKLYKTKALQKLLKNTFENEDLK